MRPCSVVPVLLVLVAWSGCAEPGPSDPEGPRFAGVEDRQTIVVNPDANGNGVAQTIQEGIDRVTSGGVVKIRPGTYAEALTIDKGLTLEPMAGGLDAVIVDPPASTATVIQVTTSEPVAIRGLTVRVPGTAGILGVGAVDITVEDARLFSVNPPSGPSNLVVVINDNATGARARMVVRNNFFDGTTGPVLNPTGPQNFAVRPQGDVDALISGNVIRRTGGGCIFVVTRADLGGVTNADIINNDLDECHPRGRVGSILVGPAAGNNPSPTRPITATGVVNIIGNTIRNSLEACQTTSAIAYELYTGRIEHNQILSVVEPCATPTGRNLPSAIWIGRLNMPLFPALTPTVRFNDIVGNAYAGLRIASNQTIAINASCNYWGANGPSGLGAGSGDAIVVETGGAAPVFAPFATAPIAHTQSTTC